LIRKRFLVDEKEKTESLYEKETSLTGGKRPSRSEGKNSQRLGRVLRKVDVVLPEIGGRGGEEDLPKNPMEETRPKKRLSKCHQ